MSDPTDKETIGTGKRYLLVNVYNFFNKGEMAALTGLVKSLPEARFTLASFYSYVDPEVCRELGIEVAGSLRPRSRARLVASALWMVWQALVWRLAHLLRVPLDKWLAPELRAYLGSDLVIDLGGDLFTDEPSPILTIVHCYSLVLALLLGRPLVLCSQSIGPFKTLFTRAVAKYVLRRARFITVREKISEDYLRRGLGCGGAVSLVADLAFLLEAEGSDPDVAQSPRERGRLLVAVNPGAVLDRWELRTGEDSKRRDEGYVEFLATLVERLAAAGEVILVPHATGPAHSLGVVREPDDRRIARAVRERLKEGRRRVSVVEDDLGTARLKALISRCDLFVGFRMHAAIAAISSGVPTVCMAFSHKAVGLQETVKAPWAAVIDVRDKDWGELLEETEKSIRRVLSRAGELAPRIARVKRLRAEAMRSVALIRATVATEPIRGLGAACWACGACVAVCPTGVIQLVPTANGYALRIDHERCTACALCERACPVLRPPAVPRATKPRAELLGDYSGLFLAHAANEAQRRKGASGGVISTLLAHALDKGTVDGALVVENRGLEAHARLVRSAEEAFAVTGSVYSPHVILGEHIWGLPRESGKYAVVGLPCQIRALRNLEALDSALRGKIALRLGLFCSHEVNVAGVRALLESMGVELEKVRELHYRAKRHGTTGLLVGLEDGNELFLPLEQYWRRFFNLFFVPDYCLCCPDLAAELSDLSFGDAWIDGIREETLRDGSSIVVARTEPGEALLRSAISEGLIHARELDAETVVRSQERFLKLKKRVFERSARGALLLAYLAALRLLAHLSRRPRLYFLTRAWLTIAGLRLRSRRGSGKGPHRASPSAGGAASAR